VRGKPLWENEDHLTRQLLRAYLEQRSEVVSSCKEFDPDLANAYIEHALTASERMRYEQHIADCDHCRRATAKLEQMASLERDLIPEPDGASWLRSPLRLPRAFITLLLGEPQRLVAVMVVVAFAIGLLLFSRNRSFDQADSYLVNQVSRSQEQELEIKPKSDANIISSPATKRAAVSSKPMRVAAKPIRPTETKELALDRQVAEVSNGSKQAAATPTQVVVGQATRAEEEVQPAPINLAQALRQQLTKIDVAQATGVTQSDQAEIIEGQARTDKRKAGRLNIKRAPLLLPSIIGSGVRRTLIGQAFVFSLGGNIAEAAHKNAFVTSAKAAPNQTDERQIGKKKFRLAGGIWMDEDYKPDKGMQVVLLVRGNDAYKALLRKHGELKAYFDGFAPSEFVIIVYKGTVYKLIPQDSDK
jgi:hypothetical protein